MALNLYRKKASSVDFYTFFVMFTFLAASWASQASADNHAGSEIPVGDLIDQIKKEVQIASLDQGEPKLALEFVEVQLQTKTAYEGEGSVEITVPVFDEVELSAGAKVAWSNTSSLEFSLRPAATTNISTDGSLGLADAVSAMREAMRQALAAEPRLDIAGFKYKTRFVLARSAEGKVKFFFLGGGASTQGEVTSQITFHINRDK